MESWQTCLADGAPRQDVPVLVNEEGTPSAFLWFHPSWRDPCDATLSWNGVLRKNHGVGSRRDTGALHARADEGVRRRYGVTDEVNGRPTKRYGNVKAVDGISFSAEAASNLRCSATRRENPPRSGCSVRSQTTSGVAKVAGYEERASEKIKPFINLVFED